MRKSMAFSLILVLALAANALAGTEARMKGKLIDAQTKKTIEGGTVKLEAVEGKTVKQEVKAKADGTYAVFILDGTIRYKVTYAAPGYAPFEEVMKLKIGDSMTRDIELVPATIAAAQTASAKAAPGIDAYNEGAALANSGDQAGALKKFEEAVAVKSDLTAAWIAIAKTAYRLQDYNKAINAAKKVVDIDDTDGDMWTVLFQSYTALGDKANAAAAEKKLPANPGTLFNEAARQINAGNDADAEKLLKQAIEMDATFAQAYYELGMVYVRAGKSAEAKEMLNKYMELDPNGKDVATAKEMLKYL